MGDEIDTLTTDDRSPPQISEPRLLRLMALLILIGAVAAAIFVGPRAGGGVVIGGVMSFVNFFWQRRSIRAIFEVTASGKKPRFLAVKYIARYLVMGSIVAIFFVTEVLPVAAIILGLSALAFAVVVEGILSIFTSSFKKES